MPLNGSELGGPCILFFFFFWLFFFVFFYWSRIPLQISAVVAGGMVKKGDFIEYDENWGLRRGALRPFVFGMWAC